MLCSGSLANFCNSAKVKSMDLGTRTNSFAYVIEHLGLLVLEIQDVNGLTKKRKKEKKKGYVFDLPINLFSVLILKVRYRA